MENTPSGHLKSYLARHRFDKIPDAAHRVPKTRKGFCRFGFSYTPCTCRSSSKSVHAVSRSAPFPPCLQKGSVDPKSCGRALFHLILASNRVRGSARVSPMAMPSERQGNNIAFARFPLPTLFKPETCKDNSPLRQILAFRCKAYHFLSGFDPACNTRPTAVTPR